VQLRDKIAVVLGASAEGGTGWAIAETLAREGAQVVIAARRLSQLQKLAQRIGGTAIQCDAAKPEDIAALAQAIADRHGSLDIAINSAAMSFIGFISDGDVADLQRSLDINYLAHVHFIRRMAAIMNDGGSITLISSSSAAQPVPSRFAYACAKAATDCLVRYAALEYGPRGIRVNSILPGPIKTEMAARVFAEPGAEAVFETAIPLGRIGSPKDFADTCVWLAKPGYITGVNLPVSGGLHLTRVPRPDEIPGGLGMSANKS